MNISRGFHIRKEANPGIRKQRERLYTHQNATLHSETGNWDPLNDSGH
jgi:hypothetical protein